MKADIANAYIALSKMPERAFMRTGKKINLLARFNIGFAYGLNILAGHGTQAYYNSGCFWAGVELAKALAEEPGWGELALEERLRTLLERIDLADEIEVVLQGDEALVVVRGCHYCPRRVGGYELDGTACLLPGLIMGFLSHEIGEKLRFTKETLDWGLGEECKVEVRLPGLKKSARA